MYISKMAMGRLRAPNDDDATGSGGGSNSDDDAGKYVTRDELAQIVNAAVSGHTKRLEKRLGDSLVSQIVAQLKTDAGQGDDDGQDDGQDDDSGSAGKAKSSPETIALKRQISALSNKLQKAEDGRAAEAKQRQAEALRSEARKLLGDAGISGRGLRGAMAELLQDGRVKLGEDGSHLFEDDDGTELPLADGLKGWASSDDAKLYLPPRDVRGSGDNGRGQAPKLGGDDDARQAAYADALEGVEKFVLGNH
jgi:hypothetical protein